jgi:hypothetical protein
MNMTNHRMESRTTDTIDAGNTDFKFGAYADNSKLGTLKISRGTVDWLPVHGKKAHYELTWTEPGELMKDRGRRTLK